MDLLIDGMNCVVKLKQSSDYIVEYLNYVYLEMCCYVSCYGNFIYYWLIRCKRFVGKMMCEKLVKKVCMMVKDLCKGKKEIIFSVS